MARDNSAQVIAHLSLIWLTDDGSNRSSAAAEMGDRLATIDMGRKVGGYCALSVGQLGPHLTECRLGLPPYQVASWSIQPFGHNTSMLQTGRQDNGLVA